MRAVHGPWCNTRTFPMRCRYCGESVFFFMCDHGSRVLFDRLGQPWPIHRCMESRQGWLKLDLGADIIPIDKFYDRPKSPPKSPRKPISNEPQYGNFSKYISDEMREELMNLIDESIDREYIEIVQKEIENERQTSTKSTWIQRLDPYHGLEATEQGIITELIKDANILKKANIPEGSIGVAMLGKYAKVKLVQMTIHTGAIAEDPQENSSFTFFVEEAVVKKQGLMKGDFVTAKLRGIVISEKYPIWVCYNITGLFD